ncbi:CoA transferase [Comamonas sp. JUb58]|uniref:CoA transferase n=1 Tax=Comamonas sp. JUb58 TaxID=2485114 RepID=UPI0010F31A5D|nr:CoA transferase [Comamonas sp. JUb58]TDS83592.1 CoA transferase family III [Comamonas sp. JUb58]
MPTTDHNTAASHPLAQQPRHAAIQASVQMLWQQAGLPAQALAPGVLALSGDGAAYPSSFCLDVAAPAAVAASGLASALIDQRRQQQPMPRVNVDVGHVLAECSGYFTIDGEQPNLWAPISGLYACGADLGEPGWLRIHANFAHHRDGVLRLLGLPTGEATPRQAVADALKGWTAQAVEERAAALGLVVAAARSPDAWQAHPQSAAVAAQPLVAITQLDSEQPAAARDWPVPARHRPLDGLHMLDLTRILAGPVAARSLAAQGADVLMLNGPGLPNIEAIADMSRGKRSALLDLKAAAGQQKMAALLDQAHVLLQGYRPGALDALGLDPQSVARLRPGIVYASLSAYGRSGPWSDRRGFDSLVQTVCGINWAEGQAFGSAGLRALPLQILDYSAGFLLAFGIQAALYRQATQGGSWHVQVSLARVAQWLQSMGQRPVAAAPAAAAVPPEAYLEDMDTGFGRLRAVRHSAVLQGLPSSWPHAGQPPGGDQPGW